MSPPGGPTTVGIEKYTLNLEPFGCLLAASRLGRLGLLRLPPSSAVSDKALMAPLGVS